MTAFNTLVILFVAHGHIFSAMGPTFTTKAECQQAGRAFLQKSDWTLSDWECVRRNDEAIVAGEKCGSDVINPHIYGGDGRTQR